MKYPNLREMTQPPPSGMDQRHHKRLRDVADVVRRRTGYEAWIDVFHEKLVFGLRINGDINLMPLAVPLFRSHGVPCVLDPILDPFDVEDVCYMIGKARESRRSKEEALRHNEVNEQMQAEEDLGQLIEQSKEKVRDQDAVRGRSSFVVKGTRRDREASGVGSASS